jgi:hypothetical protein
MSIRRSSPARSSTRDGAPATAGALLERRHAHGPQVLGGAEARRERERHGLALVVERREPLGALPQRVRERQVRVGALAVEAPALDEEHAHVLRVRDELLHDARLADARLAGDEHDVALAQEGVVEELLEVRHLGLPAAQLAKGHVAMRLVDDDI